MKPLPAIALILVLLICCFPALGEKAADVEMIESFFYSCSGESIDAIRSYFGLSVTGRVELAALVLSACALMARHSWM